MAAHLYLPRCRGKLVVPGIYLYELLPLPMSWRDGLLPLQLPQPPVYGFSILLANLHANPLWASLL